MEEIKNKINDCEHIWIAKQRKDVVDKYIPNGFFSDGMITYKIRILQVCKKCGKYNVVEF